MAARLLARAGSQAGHRPARSHHAGPRLRTCLALALVALALLASLREPIFAGRIPYENDTITYYYPTFRWAAEALRAGRFPLWTPDIFAGFPLFADGEVGLLYPINILLWLTLPVDTAFITGLALRHFLAAVFTFAYVRTLGLGRAPAALGALVFSLGSFLVTQSQHVNVVNTAIWAPLMLLSIERAARATGLERGRWLVLAGGVFGLQALGVHVQPLLITLLLSAAYLGFRFLGCRKPDPLAAFPSGTAEWGPAIDQASPSQSPGGRRRELVRRLVAGGIGLAAILGVGLALAAVQLVPLAELASLASRGQRPSYGFSSTFALPPTNLIDLVFPYFFRTDGGQWWTLWVPWETTLYFGIAPLLLAGLAIIHVRSPSTWFFGATGAASLYLALGDYPPLKLYYWLWQIPGFSVLRAPDRFALITVLSVAVLAAFGLARVLDVRRPLPRGLGPGLIGAGVGFGLLAAGMAGLRAAAIANPDGAVAAVRDVYLALPKGQSGARLAPADVYRALLGSLDLTRAENVQQLLLVTGTLALLAIAWCKPHTARVVGLLLVLVTAADLIAFASRFHPTATLAELSASGDLGRTLVARARETGGRIYGAWSTAAFEPNRRLGSGARDFDGYSSLDLAPQRSYLAAIYTGHVELADLAGVRYVISGERWRRGERRHEGVAYDLSRPLVAGTAESRNADQRFTAPGRSIDAVRVVGAIEGAAGVPDGTPVAEVIVRQEQTGGAHTAAEEETLVIRAGDHVSEAAYERENPRHRQARAIDRRDERSVYYSELKLAKPLTAREVEIRYLRPEGRLRVYGLGVVNSADESVDQIQVPRAFTLLGEGSGVAIYENPNAFPRAFLVGGAQPAKPGQPTLDLMAEGLFEPRRTALLEVGDAATAAELAQAGLPPRGEISSARAEIVLDQPERVVVKTESDTPSVLVLTDTSYPGWQATVSHGESGAGTEALTTARPARLWTADFQFRGVVLPPGRQTVEFTFRPFARPLWLGGLIVSLATLATLAATLVVGNRRPRTSPY